MTRTLKGIPMAAIAGLQTYPDYRIIFHDDRPSQLITLDDAKVLAAMCGFRLPTRQGL